ncbi:hypothetical protein N0V94_003680 [Neodidymelliopsis sp. IMI 364377]|nr:hypothetical protein N0V94_003680 [Neodidymelliopsis sp. IMI 364377]
MATARFYTSLAFEHPELAVYSIHPGAVETDMNKNAGYKEKKEGEDWDWKEGGGAADMLASPEGRFLKGRYLWANWDVDELKVRKEEIEGSNLLEMGLIGWPFN